MENYGHPKENKGKDLQLTEQWQMYDARLKKKKRQAMFIYAHNVLERY